ncbi:MAG: TIGR01212 family radical SAM protein [Thermodesulfobacteriota bacterium]|nr:TIGR01212 family radical SAM protein [Thermodesulfobacteriota bacterium]
MSHKRLYYTFNQFLREKFAFKVRKISLNAGFTCPNRDGKIGYKGCIYCYNPGFTPYTGLHFKTIDSQIQHGKAQLKKYGFKGKFLAYFQAYTNTYAPVATLKELYDEALKDDEVVGIAISTRPDCVSEDVLLLLEEYAQKTHVWIEYGLQSANDNTLKFINRGHNYAQFADAVERTQGRGIFICAHIILGLPGENIAHMYETVKKISHLKLDGIKIHHLQIVKNTLLEKMYRRKEVKVFYPEEYIHIVCNIIELLPTDIVIHRLMGDIREEFLVAPQWGEKKSEVLSMIEKELTKRGSYQGLKS